MSALISSELLSGWAQPGHKESHWQSALSLGAGMLSADVGAAAEHPSGQNLQYPLQAWLSWQVAVP